MTKAEIIDWLGKRLTPELYRHSVSTRKMVEELAAMYGVDGQKAVMAGLLHDCAKALSKEELLLHADRFHIPVDGIQLAHPGLLHAPVGAKVVELECGITDSEVLNAIAIHNTGSGGMSRLDKILYLADALEPCRDYPGVEDLRKLAYGGDLDIALLETIYMKIRHIIDRKRMLHPLSVEAWNGVLKGIGGRL